jgi:transcriptional regulator with XRE-family HTH domain
MPGASLSDGRKRPTSGPRDRAALRKRVGAFIRARREELALSQGDIIKALGYVSRNSVSNIETGREGLPAKRVFAWADLLQVPRDAFFRFATGEAERMETTRPSSGDAGERLSTAEAELVAAYRRLPPKYQRRLREQAREYETLTRAQKRGGKK